MMPHGRGFPGRFAAAAAALAIALAACRGVPEATSARGHPLGDLTIERNGQRLLRLQVEIAETPESRATGLMHVDHLPDTSGMAFLFPRPSRGSFYMKDTLIPLDIAFWAEGGRIVDVLQMQPCRAEPCAIYTPGSDYVGAVEVNLGLLARSGVERGDRVRLVRRRDA